MCQNPYECQGTRDPALSDRRFQFEWDEKKAAANIRKHSVSYPHLKEEPQTLESRSLLLAPPVLNIHPWGRKTVPDTVFPNKDYERPLREVDQ